MEITELGKRRIMKIRGSSFVNLPKFWTNYRKIEKGDLVSIVLLEDGSLKISPAGAAEC
jgi:phosphate uptake regulator